MRFGNIPVDEAAGAILAHSLAVRTVKLRKGRVLSAADVDALRAHGVTEVVAAVLDYDDVGEDAAATRIAVLLTGDGVRTSPAATGRVNLFAERAGVLVYAHDALNALNLIDEAVTAAALPAGSLVEEGQMTATLKIIPYAVPSALVSECAAAAGSAVPLLSVAPLGPRSVGLIQTRWPKTTEKALAKTARVTGKRVSGLGGRITGETRCNHEAGAIARALSDQLGAGVDMVVISGAAATSDRADTVPAGIESAGGEIEHFGMPVDPGNLLLLAYMPDGAPVVGLPGCARSPKFNGFDIVLSHLFAGLRITGRDIMMMGAGGLLQEIRSRPAPRAGR